MTRRGEGRNAVWPFLSYGMMLLVAGCNQTATKPDPHYVLGKPYQTGSMWHYPKESFNLDETGLAAASRDRSTRLTTNGEVLDQTALAAAHPSLQLPAIARLTNLENGLETTVRINDRGTGDPHRLVEITRRTAQLLGIQPDGVARVRLRVLAAESHAAAEALPGAPALALATAPRGAVETAELPPPPGVRQGSGHGVSASATQAPDTAPSAAPPLWLPEAVTQTPARPGRLVVQLDTFDEYHYAAAQQAKMAGTGATIVTTGQGRTRQYRVEIGPLPDVARADAILDQALSSGIPDARIVVD